MSFKEFDTVVMKAPSDEVKSGDVGAVVHVYSADAIEVEFVTVTTREFWWHLRSNTFARSAPQILRSAPTRRRVRAPFSSRHGRVTFRVTAILELGNFL